MHELTRMAYLQAMGIDSYVSRRQLPGAATTRRLVLVQNKVRPTVAEPPLPAAGDRPPLPPLEELTSTPPVRAASEPAPAADRASAPVITPVTRFSLAVISAGGFLWLEELQQPLAREQVALVQAMARALGGVDQGAGVQQFDWPLHNNQQLDQGEEAARAGLAGFLRRQLEQQSLRGLVLLGKACQRWVPVEQFDGVVSVRTEATLDMLADGVLKKQAWRDLLPLVHNQ